MKYKNGLFILLIISAIIFSCSNSSGPEKTAMDYTKEGWTSYTAQDYDAAEKSFLEAIKLDKAMADAYSGAGWAISHQHNYKDAISQWRTGIANSEGSADIYAGLAVVYHAVDSLDNCISAGKTLVSMNSNYTFEYDNGVDILLIHGVMAAAYYGMQDYANAASEMDLAVSINAPHNSDDLNALLKSIMDFLGLQ